MKKDSVAFPFISIVTICRNSVATIAKTIESVLAQKDQGIEYIVIDGKSTDGTQDVVLSYKSIDCFICEPDQGIADAFNKGIQVATGDIIGLINSDDQLSPYALSSVRRYFSENPDVDVIYGDVILTEGDRIIKRVRPAGRWWYPWRLVLFNHPATFVRREVYRKFGYFDSSYRIAMDVEIYLRWVSCGVAMKYIPDVFVIMNCGGVSGQNASAGCQEARQALLHYSYPSLIVNLQYVARLLINRFVSKAAK